MVIVKTYSIGDVVIIEPYDIFTTPRTPIGWNTNPYGYGEKYYPNQTFIYEHPLTLFAQYNDVSVIYNIILDKGDSNYTIYRSGFTTYLGSFIEIADFEINGFKEWQTSTGNSLSIGQRYRVMDNIELYMSADVEYKLEYKPNGGNGEMSPSYATKHLYFDLDTGLTAVDNAVIYLNKCIFTKPGCVCNRWNVDGQQYAFGSNIILNSNTNAYAEWDAMVDYSLDCNAFLVNQSLKFRYFMVKIENTYGKDGNHVTLSRIEFLDNESKGFQFPINSSASGKNVASIDSDYSLTNALYKGDASFVASKFPCGVVFDLQSQCFDTSKFTYWQISVPKLFNISSTPNNFSLYFSNDANSWYFADQCTKITPSGYPSEVIHNGLLVVDSLAKNPYE